MTTPCPPGAGPRDSGDKRMTRMTNGKQTKKQKNVKYIYLGVLVYIFWFISEA